MRRLHYPPPSPQMQHGQELANRQLNSLHQAFGQIIDLVTFFFFFFKSIQLTIRAVLKSVS